MPKYGIIFCLYNCESTLDSCLDAWKQVKNERFVYSAVSAPFKGYEDFNPPKDNTIELVRAANIMDHHFYSKDFIAEIDARGYCLDYLKSNNCDIIWMVDGDEVYTVDQINNIIKYIEDNPSTAWFKLCLKNYIFDNSTYLEEPFTPARIYRVSARPFKLGTFYQDNDISYAYGENQVQNPAVKNKVVPKKVAWIAHYTWPSNEISKLKVNYQQKRWGLCSYEWADNKLQFSEDYYKNKPKPRVIKD